MLAIDDDANESVYGAGTTPRMIFEDRFAQRPSDDVVAFRDSLEEATAAAHATRSDGTAAAAATAAVAVPQAATATPASAPAEAGMPQPAPQPTPFQPVDDNPATVEALPAATETP